MDGLYFGSMFIYFSWMLIFAFAFTFSFSILLVIYGYYGIFVCIHIRFSSNMVVSQPVQWCNQCPKILLYFWWQAEKKITLSLIVYMLLVGLSSSKCIYSVKAVLMIDFFSFLVIHIERERDKEEKYKTNSYDKVNEIKCSWIIEKSKTIEWLKCSRSRSRAWMNLSEILLIICTKNALGRVPLVQVHIYVASNLPVTNRSFTASFFFLTHVPLHSPPPTNA